MSAQTKPDLSLEAALRGDRSPFVAGIDEVGRGAWAGPLTVAAVVFPPELVDVPPELVDVTDSKQMSAVQRRASVPVIKRFAAAMALCHISPEDCDMSGMTAALQRAARSVMTDVAAVVDCGTALIDGNYDMLGAPWSVQTVIKGDTHSLSIAAASVLAKVARDDLMIAAHQDAPDYGWDSNVGYPSPKHRIALAAHGATRWHRLSWRFNDRVVWDPPDDGLERTMQGQTRRLGPDMEMPRLF